MEVEVLNNKVVITMWGKTHESDFEPLVEMFKNADDNERKRLAIIHFDGSCFKDITARKTIEWDDEAQEELEDIQGADPYLMLY